MNESNPPSPTPAVPHAVVAADVPPGTAVVSPPGTHAAAPLPEAIEELVAEGGNVLPADDRAVRNAPRPPVMHAPVRTPPAAGAPTPNPAPLPVRNALMQAYGIGYAQRQYRFEGHTYEHFSTALDEARRRHPAVEVGAVAPEAAWTARSRTAGPGVESVTWSPSWRRSKNA